MIAFAAILVASASLHITVWPAGEGHPGKHVYTLQCGDRIAGTLPKRAAACRKLTQVERPFAPTPVDMACTMIYGGPEEALVTGRFRGKLVRARFSRKDGCELARWNRVRFLFPGTSATGP
jgi:hypothetical protein